MKRETSRSPGAEPGFIGRIARTPLAHFVLGGLAIFALSAWRGEPVDPASRTIRIGADEQAQISLGFERMMGRPPTRSELTALVDRWVREEVLYREALRLGLDEDDPVIRRRLAQKMDVIAASAADAERPSEPTLQEWLAAHPDRFVRDTAIDFDQLYFGSEASARAALARLPGAAEWRELGEPSALPQSFESASLNAVSDQFGPSFSRALEGLEPGNKWQGPVETPLGWHLVRLRARQPGSLPRLADVRERVEADWRADTERTRKDAAYRVLRNAYEVEFGQ